MIFQNEIKLAEDNIVLTLLKNEHEPSLTALAAEKKIWEYAPQVYSDPAIFKEKWFNKALAQMEMRERMCFVICCDNKIVGSSSYYHIDFSNKKINMGYTWLHPSVWGSKINPLVKLIMLKYAFETLKLTRVEFAIDSLNKRSWQALEKLGIQYEGTLRNHLHLANERIRHSAIFSVISEEWLEVKNNIEKRISLSR